MFRREQFSFSLSAFFAFFGRCFSERGTLFANYVAKMSRGRGDGAFFVRRREILRRGSSWEAPRFEMKFWIPIGEFRFEDHGILAQTCGFLI